ncbi:G-protein beta WD-40 repeats containing protein [Reticulomyxa filosa]|uniref:G-protein beta WD-40 repeats containing protein n=1 Tax=Reticulomyxa filosa TaxID=46433 RepID=X6P6K1_RETFI|nr:G-protein beta WD-40 repeats containing protein [Reticulomyxa filosa]|eukprot:ETO33738.1 G-protein beta WD-40 repeats containing protein [Reticulomyxa filosa]
MFVLFSDKYLFAHNLIQATNFFMLEMFCSSSKLLKTFTGHNRCVYSIDCSTFDGCSLLCSGSDDKTVRVWDIETNEQIQLFNGHEGYVYCVKFSQYHHYNNHRIVICSSSFDKTIRFWDIKHNKQLQMLMEQRGHVYSIEFSSFNGGRYMCSGSQGTIIRLWDIETFESLHTFNGHLWIVQCVDFSPLQSNSSNKNDNNKSNSAGIIGGNGYTLCSGSWDNTIRIWDIDTTKQLNIFKGHKSPVYSVKYGSNELGISGGSNTILSGSSDKSVRLWDIRSGKQIQVFDKHKSTVWTVEYSPFIVNNMELGCSSSVICSGSKDNTIRFWDIRSNKSELHLINGYDENIGIFCLKFLQNKKSNSYRNQGINLCYSSSKGTIHIWG